jgi:hypothetical protein
MTVKQARHDLATALETVLPPPAVVKAYGVNIDAIEQATAFVIVTGIDPPSIACPTDRTQIDVLLVSHVREPGTGDDLLDDLFETARVALDALPRTVRGTAERVTYLESWPAYRIPLEIQL